MLTDTLLDMEKVKMFIFSFLDCTVSSKPGQLNNMFFVKAYSTDATGSMAAHTLQFIPLLCHLLQILNPSVNFHVLQ